MTQSKVIRFLRGLDRDTILSFFVLCSRIFIFVGIVSIVLWLLLAFDNQLLFLLTKTYEIFTSGLPGASFVFCTLGIIFYYIGKVIPGGSSD